jgi:uncharacterized protein (TIGR02145 family)
MKKLKMVWFCIALVAIVLNGCQKDADKIMVTASFTVDKASGDNPLLVNFTNTSTNAVSYKWDFGDGANSMVKDPNHSFTNSSATSEKSYTVTLTATAADNTNDTCNFVITVNKIGIIFNPDLTYGTMTDQDGNVYKTITIGTQTWMVENLKTTKCNDGTAIPNVTDGTAWPVLTTPAYCWYNNDTATNKVTYGALYNWYVVNTSKLCPTGWHVPTDAEWSTLTTYLGGGSVAGGKLKETGTTHWNYPNNGADNSSGFTALPGGIRNGNGTFDLIGYYGSWWSSSEVNKTRAWHRYVGYTDRFVSRTVNDSCEGLSVRCLRDN